MAVDQISGLRKQLRAVVERNIEFDGEPDYQDIDNMIDEILDESYPTLQGNIDKVLAMELRAVNNNPIGAAEREQAAWMRGHNFAVKACKHTLVTGQYKKARNHAS